MECPFCHAPMEAGFLQSSHQIIFAPDDRSQNALFLPTKRGDLRLTSKWTGGSLAAQYCPACRRFLVSTPDVKSKKE